MLDVFVCASQVTDMRYPIELFAFASILLAPLCAYAQPEEAPAPQPAGRPPHGPTLYAGGGAGVLPDIGEATQQFRLIAAIPVASWAMVELFPYGHHFEATSHHGRQGVTALGIGVGLRAVPWPDALVRPYVAGRFSHLHFWPDPWGEHEGPGTDSYAHTSHHRWAGALGLGFDAPLGGRSSRFRIGLEAETLLASGPGTNLGIGGLALVGYTL